MLGIVEIKCPRCGEFATISNFPEKVDNPDKTQYTRK